MKNRSPQPVLAVLAVLANLHNRRGERVEAISVTATDAKMEFGRLLERVIQGDVVVITKHDAPKAVLLPLETFNVLAEAADRRLENLSHEFDALLARMQTPRARAGMRAAFGASPKQLGKAFGASARKRG